MRTQFLLPALVVLALSGCGHGPVTMSSEETIRPFSRDLSKYGIFTPKVHTSLQDVGSEMNDILIEVERAMPGPTEKAPELLIDVAVTKIDRPLWYQRILFVNFDVIEAEVRLTDKATDEKLGTFVARTGSHGPFKDWVCRRFGEDLVAHFRRSF